MTSEELFAEILLARPEAGELVYIERRGDSYEWAREAEPAPDGSLPDVWICYSGVWPLDDADRWEVFIDDLLAEMESMGGNGDRCRWPIDQPWPHQH